MRQIRNSTHRSVYPRNQSGYQKIKQLFIKYSHSLLQATPTAQWGESYSKQTSVAIVIVFWLKWAGYLAVAGLNLLVQIFNRISPGSVLNCVHCHMLENLMVELFDEYTRLILASIFVEDP